jgi:hypothetical protein
MRTRTTSANHPRFFGSTHCILLDCMSSFSERPSPTILMATVMLHWIGFASSVFKPE